MHYDVAHLFDYYGNGDGDDYVYCAVAERIISEIEAQGFEVESGAGVHNNHRIATIYWKGGRWDCDDIEFDVWDDVQLAKLLVSLPKEVHRTLLRLSIDGVSLQ